MDVCLSLCFPHSHFVLLWDVSITQQNLHTLRVVLRYTQNESRQYGELFKNYVIMANDKSATFLPIPSKSSIGITVTHAVTLRSPNSLTIYFIYLACAIGGS